MRVGISITKRVLFRGVQQEFSNAYHYELLGALTGPWESLVDEIKASEVQFHSTDVTFVRARVWSAGGTKEQNQMLFQKVLTGVGNQLTNATMDRERAVLIRWRAGLSSHNKPVYLRKWYHCCGAAVGSAFSSGQQQNTEQIGTPHRTSLASAADAFNEVGATEAWQLCSASGRRIEGLASAHQYLEHHQLGDQWR